MQSDPDQFSAPIGGPNAPAPETASDFALTALDLACWHVLNCQLTLQALDGEVDLNLDGLIIELGQLQREVEAAYQAAKLLASRAALAPSWGRLPSRPRAIFARHKTAVVESGAVPVRPVDSNAAAFIDDIELFAQVGNRSALPASPAPQCEAIIRNGSRHCSKPALRFGNEAWASKCHIHASEAEKERHLQYQHARAAAYQRDRQRCAELRREVGRSLIASWDTWDGPLSLQAKLDEALAITTDDLPLDEGSAAQIPPDA